MRAFLLYAAGFVSCLVLLIANGAFSTYAKWQRPYGAITNQDYALVQLVPLGDEDAPTDRKYELKKGEALPLGYGTYAVTIPETKASFRIFKNSDGRCIIRSAYGVLLVESAGVAQVDR